MNKLEFEKLKSEYCNHVDNLKQYISSEYLSYLFQIAQKKGEHFVNIEGLAKTYNMISDEAKDSFLKILYIELVLKYKSLIFNSDLKSTIYQGDDIYNIRAYFEGDDPLLAFELKYDEKSDNKKIEFVFYNDLMENDKVARLNREKAHINEQLYNNEKECRNIPFDLMMNMMIGGGTSLYKEKSDCDYELGCEYRKIYSDPEFENFVTRKNLLEIYFNAFECYTDYCNIDRTNIEDGNKLTVRKYPYMDISVVFTNKRDIKDIDNSKKLIKK